MNKIEIYSKDWCPFCSKAKSLLQSKQLDYAEIDIVQGEDMGMRSLIKAKIPALPGSSIAVSGTARIIGD